MLNADWFDVCLFERRSTSLAGWIIYSRMVYVYEIIYGSSTVNVFFAITISQDRSF